MELSKLSGRIGVLHLNDVAGLRTFSPLGYVETDPLTLLQRLETLILNDGEMDEHVGTIFLLNETKTLAVVEPLYCAF